MLFIYSELKIGGIQTFYVRMARARHINGKKTKILLTRRKKDCNPQLLREAEQYAELVYLEDIAMLPAWFLSVLPGSFLLLVPLVRTAVRRLFDGVKHVHVSNSIYGLMCLRMARLIKSNCKLSIGVYHSREFLWDFEGYTPFYQKWNKRFFFQRPHNRIFFNERVLDMYREESPDGLEGANVFPLGVVDETRLKVSTLKEKNMHCSSFVIGSVGRLVSFKTYNIWMIDVLKYLIDEGLQIKYIVYGDGPLKSAMKERIEEIGIGGHIELRGTVDYQQLDCVFSEMDMFVGSGTSIIEAAARGIPSVVAIESVGEPLTYGLFSEIPGFSYNEDGLHKTIPAVRVIRSYLMAEPFEKAQTYQRHLSKANEFTLRKCMENFESVGMQLVPDDSGRQYTSLIFRLRYSLSNFIIPRLYILRGKNAQKMMYG